MPMSREELELVALQSDLLRGAMETSRAGQDLNSILTPILLEEAGFNVSRATEDILNPEYASLQTRQGELQSRLQKLDKYFNFNDGGEVTLSKAGRVQGDRRKEFESLAAEYNKTRQDLMSAQQFTQRAGDITGLERILDPGTDLRQQNEQLLLERQNAALRGDLPVNPALLSSLDEQEAELKASLLENLGPGFETSTPGIEALSKFGDRKQAILEASRRDDMATAGGLANEMGGFLQGISGNRSARVTSAGQLPFFGASNLAQVSQGFSAPLQFMQGNRALDFQISQANNSPGLMESLFAQGAGTAMTFGLADLFGV
jgi:hypothetical protein